MEVKNTFLQEMPPTPGSSMPTPVATAPAMGGFSLKDSLLQAVSDPTFGLEDMQPTATLSQESLDAHTARRMARARQKPDPLMFMSTQSMLSIPESPGGFAMPAGGMATFEVKPTMPAGGLATFNTTQVRHSSSGFLAAGPPSIPGTPVQQWEVGTPTGTPTMFAAPVASAPLVQQQQAAPRQTLSLVDMIQSPQGGMNPVMMPSVFQQPPQQQPPVQVLQQFTQPQMVVQSAPPPQYVQQAPQMQVLPSSLAQMQGCSGQAPPAAASVMLGLVSQPAVQQMRIPSASMAVGTLGPPQQPPVYAMSQPAPMYAAPPTLGMQQAPPRSMPPPPPMMAAPAAMLSPQGGPPNGMAFPGAAPTPEGDLKVLYDLAVASGNRQAMDAILRQAAGSGMSPDQIRATFGLGALSSR